MKNAKDIVELLLQHDQTVSNFIFLCRNSWHDKLSGFLSRCMLSFLTALSSTGSLRRMPTLQRNGGAPHCSLPHTTGCATSCTCCYDTEPTGTRRTDGEKLQQTRYVYFFACILSLSSPSSAAAAAAATKRNESEPFFLYSSVPWYCPGNCSRALTCCGISANNARIYTVALRESFCLRVKLSL